MVKANSNSVQELQQEQLAPAAPAVASALLLLLLLLSTFATIYSTHACRALYAQLQVIESSQWYLQEDYGRLLLEQSTQASHYRVEKVARENLGMSAPDLAQYKVVPR